MPHIFQFYVVFIIVVTATRIFSVNTTVKIISDGYKRCKRILKGKYMPKERTQGLAEPDLIKMTKHDLKNCQTMKMYFTMMGKVMVMVMMMKTIMTEAIAWRCSQKFRRIHKCPRVSFLISYRPKSLAQLFSCEFCEISKNTFFTEHLRWLLLK